MAVVYWIVVPILALPLLLLVRAFLRFANGGGGAGARRGITSQAYDPKTGIGRGAPGFQTNVKRLAVTPEIAARIRRGEDVSPEEIAASSAEAERRRAAQEADGSVGQNGGGGSGGRRAGGEQNEWLPEGIAGSAARARAGGKKGRR